MKKEKIMYRLLDSLIMLPEEIKTYNELPDNLPQTVLTAKQKNLVFELYYKYLSGKICIGWGTDLSDVEKREKWPSGHRMKGHEAQRIILCNLIFINSKPTLTAEEAADKFHSCLTCRETYVKLVQSAYVRA